MPSFRRLVPRRSTYLVLSADVQSSRTNLPVRLDPAPYELETVTGAALARIDTARPGYAATASRYLAAGHVGLACVLDGKIVGLGWYAVNSAASGRKRALYFPLEPGEMWLHSAWTQPEHRGRGIQKLLLRARLATALATAEVSRALVNVEAGNAPSLHNCRAVGFSESGRLVVLSWWRWRYGWRQP